MGLENTIEDIISFSKDSYPKIKANINSLIDLNSAIKIKSELSKYNIRDDGCFSEFESFNSPKKLEEMLEKKVEDIFLDVENKYFKNVKKLSKTTIGHKEQEFKKDVYVYSDSTKYFPNYVPNNRILNYSKFMKTIDDFKKELDKFASKYIDEEKDAFKLDSKFEEIMKRYNEKCSTFKGFTNRDINLRKNCFFHDGLQEIDRTKEIIYEKLIIKEDISKNTESIYKKIKVNDFSENIIKSQYNEMNSDPYLKNLVSKYNVALNEFEKAKKEFQKNEDKLKLEREKRNKTSLEEKKLENEKKRLDFETQTQMQKLDIDTIKAKTEQKKLENDSKLKEYEFKLAEINKEFELKKCELELEKKNNSKFSENVASLQDQVNIYEKEINNLMDEKDAYQRKVVETETETYKLKEENQNLASEISKYESDLERIQKEFSSPEIVKNKFALQKYMNAFPTSENHIPRKVKSILEGQSGARSWNDRLSRTTAFLSKQNKLLSGKDIVYLENIANIVEEDGKLGYLGSLFENAGYDSELITDFVSSIRDYIENSKLSS